MTRHLPTKTRVRRQKYDCLDLLTGDEAQAVLQDLLSAHPDLVPHAEAAAKALLATVSFTDVADSVLGVVQALDLDDLDAGPHAWGYVEPSEAALEAIENAVKPYLHDLERRIKLGHENEALEISKGIVLGLYRAERDGAELFEYAVDCPSEFAGQAVELWRRRRRALTFPPEFAERSTPEWDWLLGPGR